MGPDQALSSGEEGQRHHVSILGRAERRTSAIRDTGKRNSNAAVTQNAAGERNSNAAVAQDAAGDPSLVISPAQPSTNSDQISDKTRAPLATATEKGDDIKWEGVDDSRG